MERRNHKNHRGGQGLAARARRRCQKVLTNPLTYVLLAAVLFRVVYFHTLRPYSETADSPTYKDLGNILTGLRTPIYPLLLAGLKALFGEPLMNMVLVRLQKPLPRCARWGGFLLHSGARDAPPVSCRYFYAAVRAAARCCGL